VAQAIAEPQVMNEEEFALFAARRYTPIILISLAFLAAGILQGVRSGWSSPAKLLAYGGVASIIGTFLYARSLMLPGRSFRKAIYGAGGFLPHMFSLYLCLYRGLWESHRLLDDFSIDHVAAIAAFLYLGYRLAWWTLQMTEVGVALQAGNIVISGPIPGRIARETKVERVA
jgi:hypothetical protein